MVVKTVEQYIGSLRALNPKIYLFGKEIKDYVDNPIIRRAINAIAENYCSVSKASNEDRNLMIATSYFTGEKIARFNQIHKSPEDLVKMAKMAEKLGILSLRHMTNEPLNSLYVTTYEIDEKYGTDYHKRFTEYTKHVQGEDLFCAITQTDPKGDRSLRPSKQADPYVYLKIVEKRSDGIIVRGAKISVSHAVGGAHELMVIPTRTMLAEESDYALSFAVPIDTEGVIMVPRMHPPHAKEFENPFSFKYAREETFIIFNDVFVPWEKVFMCGEWDFTTRLIATEAAYHRYMYCGYEAGILDLLIGATQLIAEYNGVEGASHIRDKIADMILRRSLIYACGLAAAVEGIKTPSGAYMPNPLLGNAGKYTVSTTIYEDLKLLHNVAGGLTFTMPSEEDYTHKQIEDYMDKYLVGKSTIPTEKRLRLFRLIEDLTLSEMGAWVLLSRLHGGGSPAASKIMVLREYDLEESKRIANTFLKIQKEK